MKPLTGFTEYRMRVAQATGAGDLFAQLDAELGAEAHDYAQAYGPGGAFDQGLLNTQAGRASGRIQPAPFAVGIYEAMGYGKMVDGKFEWAASFTEPYTGMPKL